jgi:hypothetical protein
MRAQERHRMFPNNAIVHENVMPEMVKNGRLELRQDVLGRDYKGKSNKGIAKKTSGLITKVRPALSKFLEAGEQVLYVARVQRHASGVIQYTMGWYIYYAAATVIVLTDRRLLHLRVKNNNEWDKGIRSCAWSEIESAQVKGWLSRALYLKFKNGTKYRYWRISRADALNIEKILPLLLKAHEGAPQTSGSPSWLCPECKHVLETGTEHCQGCGLAFKRKKTMYWLSLVPAAAYIYTRKWFLAFGDFVGQGYAYVLLTLALFAFIGAALGVKGANGKSLSMNDGVSALIVGLIIFGLDVIITINHNNYFLEDFIPTDKKAQPAESVKKFAVGGTIG